MVLLILYIKKGFVMWCVASQLFHLVQALCAAFALGQQGEAGFVCKTELLWPSQTVCQWVYCNVFSFSPNKWSKLCNRDVNVSGSYLSLFCLPMFKTK